VIAVYLQPKMVARLKRREMVSEGYTATLVASALLVSCSNLGFDFSGNGALHSGSYCQLMLNLSGETSLAALDAFGWGVVVFIALIFGIPYSRYFLRMRAIPTWPTAEATVVAASARRGSPTVPGWVPVWTAGLLNCCQADYEYQVDGVLRKGSFALMAGNEEIAATVAQRVLQMKILIRFNPKHPADSIPVAEEIIERTVVVKQSWLNPNVW
jgi:hypothetical protein